MISVIIPTYNRRDLLEQTLASVRSSNPAEREIIVIDDGSTDDTRDYLDQQDDLKWYPQQNSGPAAARNLGASKANGDYLAFLDSDDLWFPWTLDTYRELIQRYRPAFAAGKPFRFEEVSLVASAKMESFAVEVFRDYLASGDDWRWWGCSSFLVEKAAFEKAGGFADTWINAEDADMAMRLGTAGKFVQVKRPYTFAYREHAVSAMKDSERNIKGARHLLSWQREGKYPGYPERKWEQWRIISRHLRPVSLNLLATGNRNLAWRIYFSTLPWHLKEFRWKFILGFLAKAAK